jgi:hypothetical protein
MLSINGCMRWKDMAKSARTPWTEDNEDGGARA